MHCGPEVRARSPPLLDFSERLRIPLRTLELDGVAEGVRLGSNVI